MNPTPEKTRWPAWKVLAWLLGALVVIGVPVVVSLNRKPLPPDELQPAQLLGNPLRLRTAVGERILVLTQQYGVHWYWHGGSGRRSFGGMASEQVINVDLWAFEPGKAKPLWRRRFKNNTPGVMTSVGDMMLGHGDSVWLELAEPVLVAADDGRLLPSSGRSGEPVRGDAVYDLRDLQARGQRVQHRWIGVLTTAEHSKLTGPGGEDWRPDSVGFAGDDADYGLWSARVRDVPESWGKRELYSGYEALGAAKPFHRAGLLRLAQRGETVAPEEPASVIVLHHEPEAVGGRLMLSRIEASEGNVLWTAATPLARLRHLLGGEHDLVLAGEGPRPARSTADGGVPAGDTWLAFVDLRGGELQTFDLARASLDAEPPPLE